MSSEKSTSTWRYIGQRALQTVVIWFIIITLNFVIFRVMPGDPRQALIGEGLAPELRVAVIERFGLDRPLIEQYWIYLINLFQGELGFSFSHFGEPVVETIFAFRFMNTFLLQLKSLASDHSLLHTTAQSFEKSGNRTTQCCKVSLKLAHIHLRGR